MSAELTSALRREGRRGQSLSAGGFTLTEILLIAALTGLIATAGGASAFNTYKRYLVEKGARQFYLAARYARLFATEQHVHCRLMIDRKNQRFYVTTELSEGLSEEGVRMISNTYTKPTELNGRVQFEKVSVFGGSEPAAQDGRDGAVITFYPNGTADMSAIQLGDGESCFSVYVMAATGKVRVESGPAAAAPVEVIDLDREGF